MSVRKPLRHGGQLLGPVGLRRFHDGHQVPAEIQRVEFAVTLGLRHGGVFANLGLHKFAMALGGNLEFTHRRLALGLGQQDDFLEDGKRRVGSQRTGGRAQCQHRRQEQAGNCDSQFHEVT